MKKLLYTFLAVSIIFSACKKEDEANPNIDNTSNIEQIIVDKIWKGNVPDFSGTQFGNDIIFELKSNDSLYIYTSGCTQTITNYGTWNISGKIITYNRVINSIEYLDLPFGELTEYSVTQLKFKIDSNTNAICEIYNLSTQNCTYIPDYYFESYLINMGYDDVMDDYVLTSNINTITYLDVSYWDISDLTGIEDFTALTYLNCSQNQLSSLDLSANTSLTSLSCVNNLLISLDVRNGNNPNMLFESWGNSNLTCISVDDVAWSINNWFNVDFQHYFSEQCP